MVVRLSGGPNYKIETLFMELTKKDCKYPILETTDRVDGVSYRTGSKGWMDTAVMTQCI